MELQQRFEQTLSLYIKDDEVIQQLWTEIVDHYAQKDRAYHNLTHLEELFKQFDTHQHLLESPHEVAIAIFYHDIIYNIWNQDNEAKSAEFMTLKLNAYLDTDHISQLIMVTKTHDGNTNDSSYMIDFDIAILGQSSEIYTHYADSIRQEYIEVPIEMYNPGRINVLKHFLDKRSIYQTDIFIKRYEKQARQNMKTELELLNGAS